MMEEESSSLDINQSMDSARGGAVAAQPVPQSEPARVRHIYIEEENAYGRF